MMTRRAFIFSACGLLAILVSLAISTYLMNPLVDFYSIFNFTSLSHNQLSPWLVVALAFLVLDLANYLIHRFIHFVPFLWRFHRLHHSDSKVDALTTVLHHPLEVFINSIFIVGFYVAFDLPIVLIIFYDILLALHDAFAHSTIVIPKPIEKWLGYIFVMPVMHRLHHALDMRHGNSNYGSVFSFWDRLLGTYTDTRNMNSRAIVFGIETTQTPKSFSAKELLLNPFI